MNVLEAELDEIDVFIQSELGFLPLSPGESLTTTEVNELSCFLPEEELLNESPLWNSSGQKTVSIYLRILRLKTPV